MNLLEQAIDADGDHAAKLIRDALGIEADDVANTASRRLGPLPASSAPASLTSGCRPNFWLN
jgi:hypothetical protein